MYIMDKETTKIIKDFGNYYIEQKISNTDKLMASKLLEKKIVGSDLDDEFRIKIAEEYAKENIRDIMCSDFLLVLHIENELTTVEPFYETEFTRNHRTKPIHLANSIIMLMCFNYAYTANFK